MHKTTYASTAVHYKEWLLWTIRIVYFYNVFNKSILVGNMWGQSWNNLGDILSPYPAKPSLNVTGEMIRQGWTPKIMFQKADDFFQSMGLDPMPKE